MLLRLRHLIFDKWRILFGMLVILEITDPRHAAEHFPKYVVETQAWAAGLSLLRQVNGRHVSANGRRQGKDVGRWNIIEDKRDRDKTRTVTPWRYN